MGFNDSEFDSIEGHFKKADIYKMSGNSIVVDVAEELLCMLFDEEGNFFCLKSITERYRKEVVYLEESYCCTS